MSGRQHSPELSADPLIEQFAALVARARPAPGADESSFSRERLLIDEVLKKFLDTPGTKLADLLERQRIDVASHQLEVLVSLFYSKIDDVYIGVDSHLPSRFLRVHPFLLENLAASEGPSVAVGARPGHSECHAARWVRIVPHSIDTLAKDFAKHEDIAGEYFKRHEQHGITLLSVEPDEVAEAGEDILMQWTTDLGLWVNSCALLFEPSIRPSNKELRLQLVYPSDETFEKCKRYVKRLIEHSSVVKVRNKRVVGEPMSDHDRQHLLWGLQTMFEPQLADQWHRFVSAQARVEALGPFVEDRIQRLKTKRPRILDAATGIGCDSIYLIDRGYDVVSNEIEHKFASFAREVAETSGVKLKLKRYDWRHFEHMAQASSFDVVLAFGNSLSCLEAEVDVRAVLARFCHLLRPGGLLIVDERNYPAMAAKREEMTRPDFRIPPTFPYCGTSIQARPIDVPDRLGVDGDLLTLEYDQSSDGEKVGTFKVLPFAEGQLRGLLEDTGFVDIEALYNLRDPNGSAESAAFVTYCARRRTRRDAKTNGSERVIAFTDVTESGATRKRLGEANYAVEWEKHEAKVRRVIGERRGKVHKKIGDGIMISFPDAVACVEAMREIVSAPGTSKLKVRAGINMGPVFEDAGGDLSSRAVDVAKRICDCLPARPDRLVVDDRVRLATLTEGYAWKSLGNHDLPGNGNRALWQFARASNRTVGD
jgi:glycine/sarcosine N-methyltransferase